MIANLLSGPSGFLLAGASAMVTVFDAGRRHAVSDQAQAAYDQSVANYRETVLGAFQEVEDNLAALRILQDEAKTQRAGDSPQQTRWIGHRPATGWRELLYLEVICTSLALSDERTAVQILGRRITASVLLVRALGEDGTVPVCPKDRASGRLINDEGRPRCRGQKPSRRTNSSENPANRSKLAMGCRAIPNLRIL